jgi:hypothetical protein
MKPHTSTPEFQQYRQARLNGYSIVNALLKSKFEAGIRDIAEFEKTIEEQLAKEASQIAPWHRTPLTQAASRDGMRLAALEFYWEHRYAIDVRLLAISFGDEIADLYHATAQIPDLSDDYWMGRFAQIKARFAAIRQRFPDLAHAFTEGLALLTFEGSHIQ